MDFYETKPDQLLGLQIGEKADINKWSDLTRVPGGWVYNTYSRDEYNENSPITVACCFVPEPSEPIFAELSTAEDKSPVFVFPDGYAIDMQHVRSISSVFENIEGGEAGFAFTIEPETGRIFNYGNRYKKEADKRQARLSTEDIQIQARQAFQKFGGIR